MGFAGFGVAGEQEELLCDKGARVRGSILFLWVVSEAGVGLRDYAPAWFGLSLEVRSRHFTWKLRLRE